MTHMLRMPKPRRTYNEKGIKIYEEITTYGGGTAETIWDDNGNEIFTRSSSGYWSKTTYDTKGNKLLQENSEGSWYKYFYDEEGKILSRKSSCGGVKEYITNEEGIVEIKYYWEIKKGFNREYILLQLKKLFKL